VPTDILHISTFGRMRIHEVCVSEGLYAAENLTVELDVTQSSKVQMQKLKDGIWDIVHTNADNVYWWNEDNGADFVIFLATPGRPNQDFIVRPEIKGYEDLRGKVIAVDAAESGYVTPLRLLLQQGDLAVEGRDYTFVEVGATQQRIDAMRGGLAVGAMIGSEQANNLVAEGYRRLDTINRLYTHYSGSAAARRDWIASNTELLQRYLRAHLRGARAAGDAMAGVPFGWDGLQEMMTMRKQVGLLRGAPDPHRFADDSYYRQALASI
jgi:ABC-type nitrate/sulfonate/bicarbonate transport system substrate-binding protein